MKSNKGARTVLLLSGIICISLGLLFRFAQKEHEAAENDGWNEWSFF